MRIIVLLLMALSLIACPDKATTPQPKSDPKAEPKVEPTAEPAEPAAETETEDGYIVTITALRKEPTDAKNIETEDGKKVANWIATLHRGEKVTLSETSGEFRKASLAGDVEGWMFARSVVTGEDLSLATVLEETNTFDRPDPVASNAKRKIPAGSLLLSLKVEDGFTQVNYLGSASAWVKTSTLANTDDEIVVSKLFSKARWLRDRKGGVGVAELIELAREEYASAALTAVMVAELVVEEDAGGGGDDATEESPDTDG